MAEKNIYVKRKDVVNNSAIMWTFVLEPGAWGLHCIRSIWISSGLCRSI